MANLELKGRLNRKLPVQSGVSARGEWSKQEFIIDYQDGNYPATACFNVWGPERVKDLERFQYGDDVKVSFTINSREFNGKWYTDLRAWKIEHVAPEQPAQAPYTQAPQAQSAPYAQAPAAAPSSQNVPAGFAPTAPAAPSYDEGNGAGEMTDDLPF